MCRLHRVGLEGRDVAARGTAVACPLFRWRSSEWRPWRVLRIRMHGRIGDVLQGPVVPFEVRRSWHVGGSVAVDCPHYADHHSANARDDRIKSPRMQSFINENGKRQLTTSRVATSPSACTEFAVPFQSVPCGVSFGVCATVPPPRKVKYMYEAMTVFHYANFKVITNF